MSRAARAEQAWRSEWSERRLPAERVWKWQTCAIGRKEARAAVAIFGGARTFLSATVGTAAWSADISVRNRANGGVGSGQCPRSIG